MSPENWCMWTHTNVCTSTKSMSVGKENQYDHNNGNDDKNDDDTCHNTTNNVIKLANFQATCE